MPTSLGDGSDSNNAIGASSKQGADTGGRGTSTIWTIPCHHFHSIMNCKGRAEAFAKSLQSKLRYISRLTGDGSTSSSDSSDEEDNGTGSGHAAPRRGHPLRPRPATIISPPDERTRLMMTSAKNPISSSSNNHPTDNGDTIRRDRAGSVVEGAGGCADEFFDFDIASPEVLDADEAGGSSRGSRTVAVVTRQPLPGLGAGADYDCESGCVSAMSSVMTEQDNNDDEVPDVMLEVAGGAPGADLSDDEEGDGQWTPSSSFTWTPQPPHCSPVPTCTDSSGSSDGEDDFYALFSGGGSRRLSSSSRLPLGTIAEQNSADESTSDHERGSTADVVVTPPPDLASNSVGARELDDLDQGHASVEFENSSLVVAGVLSGDKAIALVSQETGDYRNSYLRCSSEDDRHESSDETVPAFLELTEQKKTTTAKADKMGMVGSAVGDRCQDDIDNCWHDSVRDSEPDALLMEPEVFVGTRLLNGGDDVGLLVDPVTEATTEFVAKDSGSVAVDSIVSMSRTSGTDCFLAAGESKISPLDCGLIMPDRDKRLLEMRESYLLETNAVLNVANTFLPNSDSFVAPDLTTVTNTTLPATEHILPDDAPTVSLCSNRSLPDTVTILQDTITILPDAKDVLTFTDRILPPKVEHISLDANAISPETDNLLFRTDSILSPNIDHILPSTHKILQPDAVNISLDSDKISLDTDNLLPRTDPVLQPDIDHIFPDTQQILRDTVNILLDSNTILLETTHRPMFDRDSNDPNGIGVVHPDHLLAEVVLTLRRPSSDHDCITPPEAGTSHTDTVALHQQLHVDVNLTSGRRQHSNDCEPQSPDDDRPRRVRRCSSLKSGKTPPGTPHRKKIVSFADALGLDLADIRTIFSDDLPNVPHSAFADLDAAEQIPPFSTATTTTTCPLYDDQSAGQQQQPLQQHPHQRSTLVPVFPQPASLPDFVERLRRQSVCLESATVSGESSAVRLVIRVLNLDFRKVVRVRYTRDEWRSHVDVSADYAGPGSHCAGGSSGGGEMVDASDRFSTVLLLADRMEPGERLSFAVCFTVLGRECWDSNDGINYTFQCYPENVPSPLSSGDDSWIHFL